MINLGEGLFKNVKCPKCGHIAWEVLGGRPVRAKCRVCDEAIIRLANGWNSRYDEEVVAVGSSGSSSESSPSQSSSSSPLPSTDSTDSRRENGENS